MPNMRFLEWVLSRFTTRDRAVSILGDLLEDAESNGRLWFWTSLARVFFSLAWRKPTAFFVAYAIGGAIFASLTNADPLWNEIGFKSIDPSGPIAVAAVMIVIPSAVALWFLAPYSVLRFGLRDQFTQIKAPLFIVTTVGVLFRDFTIACAVITIATILVGLFLYSWRRSLIALSVTVGAGVGALTGMVSLIDKTVDRYPALSYILHWLMVRMACLLSFGILIAVYSRMHSIQRSRTRIFQTQI